MCLYINICLYTCIHTHIYTYTHTVSHMTNGYLSVPGLVSKYLNFCNWHVKHVSRNRVSCHFRWMNVPSHFMLLGTSITLTLKKPTNAFSHNWFIILQAFVRLTSNTMTLQLSLLRNTYLTFYENVTWKSFYRDLQPTSEVGAKAKTFKP